MTTQLGNEPAYPTLLTGKWAGTGTGATFAPDMTDGLTKREAFAMAAMQGYCANPEYAKAICSLTKDEPGMNALVLARMSIHAADALLNELNKPTAKP